MVNEDDMDWPGEPSSSGAAGWARSEDVYGWCGLCRSFTVWPHPCPGQDQPVTDDAA